MGMLVLSFNSHIYVANKIQHTLQIYDTPTGCQNKLTWVKGHSTRSCMRVSQEFLLIIN